MKKKEIKRKVMIGSLNLLTKKDQLLMENEKDQKEWIDRQRV